MKGIEVKLDYFYQLHVKQQSLGTKSEVFSHSRVR